MGFEEDSEMEFPERLHSWNGARRANLSKAEWIVRVAAALLVALVFVGPAADADEFDPLLVYREARPLDDEWQACAASFVRGRLQSRQTPEVLAREALDACQAQQDRLRRFFVGKIGRKSAENVITILRERYQSDLSAAINELRTRD
jgi:hypothetical protein